METTAAGIEIRFTSLNEDRPKRGATFVQTPQIANIRFVLVSEGAGGRATARWSVIFSETRVTGGPPAARSEIELVDVLPGEDEGFSEDDIGAVDLHFPEFAGLERFRTGF